MAAWRHSTSVARRWATLAGVALAAACVGSSGCSGDDTAAVDAGGLRDDAGPRDAGALDAGERDAGAAVDAGAIDAGAPPLADAGAPDAWVRVPGHYLTLSETGLYDDIASKTLSADVVAFEPRYTLWSDGALKRRWIALPPGTTIDTTDLDRWRFPVGTRFFKEFAAPDGTLLETRLVEHVADTGDLDVDYFLSAFIWRADASDADITVAGADNVLGTEHDVPSQTRCHTCHNGEPGRTLGFSAVQLAGSGPPGLRLADLVRDGRLSAPPASPDTIGVPGDAVTAAALGYLHANCGHCHNPIGPARPDTDMDLRVRATDLVVADTGAFRTAIGVAPFRFTHAGITSRVEPGAPDASCVVYRMSTRGSSDQMPPIATEVVDPDGVAAVRAWISAL